MGGRDRFQAKFNMARLCWIRLESRARILEQSSVREHVD
jgi:hypothetical protein